MGVDQRRVLHAAAAETLVVAVEDLMQRAGHGQADLEAVITHGGEVGHADHIAAVSLGRAQEGDRAAPGVVHVEPLEPIPRTVNRIEGGGVRVELVEARI